MHRALAPHSSALVVAAWVATVAAACGARSGLQAGSASEGGASSATSVVTVGAGGAGGSLPLLPPRPIAPLSTATVTAQRPTLHWKLAPSTDGAHVELCRDRACANPLGSFDASGTSGAPATALPPGVVFWRLSARSGGHVGSATSPTWEFFVGHRSAPVDTSWGTVLDGNGDGLADVVVGAPGASMAYVFAGAPGGLDPTSMIPLAGAASSQFGLSVASAGDVDGDGFADLVVGAPYESGGGAVYLYPGGPQGFSDSKRTRIAPPAAADTFGSAVASAGDVDGDGYADVVIGAPDGDVAYLYLGGPSGLSSSPLVLHGPQGTASFGASVAGAGDVNGDGFGDFVVGDWSASNEAGQAFVFLGGPGGVATAPNVTLTGADATGYFGGSVACAGDVNGDGLADLVVGAEVAANYAGKAYVYLGGAAGTASTPHVTWTGTDMYAQFGGSVAGAGDVDGDGFADVVVGAGAFGIGKAFLFRGSPAGPSSSPTVVLGGPAPASQFGVAVAGVGDTNGDGFAEIAVGAIPTDNGEDTVAVYEGGAAGSSTTPITLVGPGVSSFGAAIACADLRATTSGIGPGHPSM